MTDLELIQLAQTGDARAIRDLYGRHAARVFTVVRRLAGDDALAEDWAQEAWVRVFRALPSFRGESRFTTWLHRIAVNSALHGRRWRERRAKHETALPPTLTTEGGNQAVVRMRIEKALEKLPERMRQVLVLHDVEGYTHEEIAEFMGVTPGTSKSQLFKARARMRELLHPKRGAMNGEEVCLT